MEIPKNINDEVWEYCRVNNIPNIENFMVKMLKQGFTSEKYGAMPIQQQIIEKIIEVPVEKIVEKIIEVPIKVDDGVLNDKYNTLLRENGELKLEIENLKKIKKRDIYGE
jgi:hypothetical protein